MKEMTLEKAKEKFNQFEISVLFMDLEEIIDCSGVTFKEWLKAEDIKIV